LVAKAEAREETAPARCNLRPDELKIGGTRHVLYWPLIVLIILAASLAAGHALLYKRDPKATWGWIAVCLISPPLGPLLYLLFGINRIHPEPESSSEDNRHFRMMAPSLSENRIENQSLHAPSRLSFPN
jgi:hypothetical protein